MATHSSTLPWKIPWMVKPGGLPSMVLHRVRHDCSDLASRVFNEGKRDGIWSHHFIANRKGRVEAVIYFIFLGSKITADLDCSHEIELKRCLFLGRGGGGGTQKPRQHIKSRDITLPTNFHIVKAMVFPIVMY